MSTVRILVKSFELLESAYSMSAYVIRLTWPCRE